MMAELFGRVDGYCKGKGGSMHIADFSIGMLGANGIVGGGLPIASGAALAAQLDGKGRVAVCFFGDGAVAEGEFHEALNQLGVGTADRVRVREQSIRGQQRGSRAHPEPELAEHARAYQCLASLSTATTCWPSTMPCARGRACARGRRPVAGRMQDLSLVFPRDAQRPAPRNAPGSRDCRWKARDPIARFTSDLVARGLVAPAERNDGQAIVLSWQLSPSPRQARFRARTDLLLDLFAPEDKTCAN